VDHYYTYDKFRVTKNKDILNKAQDYDAVFFATTLVT